MSLKDIIVVLTAIVAIAEAIQKALASLKGQG